MAKPLKIKRGPVTVKIYPTRYAGRTRYEVRYKFGSKLYRHKRAKRSAAILLAEQRAAAIANGRTAHLQLTDHDAYEWRYITSLAARHGLTPRQLADGYAEIVEQKTSTEHFFTATASAIVEKFLAHKNTLGLDDYTTRDYGVRLKRFAADFQLPFARITAADFTEWLDALPVLNNKGQPLKVAGTLVPRAIGPRTRNNYLAALRDLATFAREHKHIPPDWDELRTLKRIKTRGRKLIFTASEIATLLQAAQDRIIPALTLGAFAGLRTEEIELLEWHHIDWDAGVIHVPDTITKTGESRLAPLVDNLRAWLEQWRYAHGPVNTYANLSNQKSRLAKKVGLKWRHNALRHSFGTYRVAVTRTRHQVSIEMGNSEREIKNSYERPRTAAEGLKWFEIRPQNVPNGVLNLKFA